MARKSYPRDLKREVELMRSAGKTYAEIRKIHPIPKSTLSNWLGEEFSGIFDRKAQLKHLKKIRLLASESIRGKKELRISEAFRKSKETAKLIPASDVTYMKSLLAMLYWAEGTKRDGTTSLVFTNTDPRLAHLYISMLRKCFPIDERKFRIRLHLHHYHSRVDAIAFWSGLLQVPAGQFGKIHIKKRGVRKKFRRNFSGICFIIYHDASVLRELMALAHEVYGVITRSVLPAGIEPTFFPPQGNVLSVERREQSAQRRRKGTISKGGRAG